MPKKKTSRPKPQKAISVAGVKVLWDTEPPAVYSNFAVAASRPYGEFSVVLCALSNEDARPNQDGELEALARIVASVRLHPQAFFALVNLLGTTWNKWADQVGEPSTARFRVEIPQTSAKGVAKGSGKREEDGATTK